MRKALVIGIDDYETMPLNGCVNDATKIASLLETHGDGSPNFAVRRITSNDDEDEVTTAALTHSLEELFSGEADTALFYFAGHGIIDPLANQGFLVTVDGHKPNWGLSLSTILTMANRAHPRIKSSIIILDSCHSGFAGELQGLAQGGEISAIGNGVTILTACDRAGTAAEDPANCHGTFTSLLLDALNGAAADIRGRISPASIYSHIDQTLGVWDQRPIYKANVRTFMSLRDVPPKVSLDVLRRLPIYFPNANDVFALDPSFEPDRGEFAQELTHIPVNEDNVRIYKELQQCSYNSLVRPLDQPHMWHAAVHATGCRLTATGAHYRKLAEMGRI
ncbi:caspase domain-containing protein [Kordiimonas lipolytica]|uniref:Caspase domain-containing protein n=1 Tax=Kordiimonas lipolytica TaxID=1662421 RepID=A0ABV8UGG4_9PROT|nr:caspase family protein [Kordiimonas lipolytica]